MGLLRKNPGGSGAGAVRDGPRPSGAARHSLLQMVSSEASLATDGLTIGSADLTIGQLVKWPTKNSRRVLYRNSLGNVPREMP